MADTYTKEDVSDVHDKDVRVTKAWKEDKIEMFTIRECEQRIVDCDSQIASATNKKTEYQTMIAEAEKVLAE